MTMTKLKNMNAFVDGIGYQGKIEEIEMPKITMATEDFSAGGMSGTVEVEMGLEKLETTLTFTHFLPEIAKLFARGISDTPLRLRGAVENDETLKVDTVEVILRGRAKELDLGTWKRGENNSFKLPCALTYFKLRVNDEDIIEADPINMILVVDGQDRYAAQREALGI